MESEKLMGNDELDALVERMWQTSKEGILKQVEYSVAQEMSSRARSRAQALIIREVDTILKPKLEALRGVMETKAEHVLAGVLPKLEEAIRHGMEHAIREVCEYTVRQVLAQAEQKVRTSMLKAVEPDPEACDECGAVEPPDVRVTSMIASWHRDSCSLHPKNSGGR